MRAVNKLTSVSLKSLPAGKHEDGAGLRLVKQPAGSGQWVVHFTVHGRGREMGLGPWPDITLKIARERAAEAR